MIVLPILAFSVEFINFLGRKKILAENQGGWRQPFLHASLRWGAFLAVITEGLSLANSLKPIPIAIFWTVALILSAWLGWRKGYLGAGIASMQRIVRDLKRLDIVMLIPVVAILMVLLAIALIAPPNNIDSLQYHMSRVVHWAQNGNLRHYPTTFEPQLFNPIWAEIAILNLRLLWGNDQFANTVQWFSMLASLIGVSAIAELLGGRRIAQWASVVFAISLPMGLLQATTTQNDYVTSYWMVCLAYFVTLGHKRQLSTTEFFSLALALGLGLLTKGTFYPYAIAFGIWYTVSRLRKQSRNLNLFQFSTVLGSMILLNIGYWTRNTITYGGPLGPSAWVREKTTGQFEIGALIVRLIKNTLLNFPTPFENVNNMMISLTQNLADILGHSPDNFQLTWAWNHEDWAGNPLHAAIVLISIAILVISSRRSRNPVLFWYASVTCATFIFHALIASFDAFGARLQLPFWVTWAPAIGVVVSSMKVKWLAPVGIGILLTATIPWLLFNRSRPLISMREHSSEPFTIPCIKGLGCTSSGSILHESSSTLLFANWTEIRDGTISAVESVQQSNCQNVGLRIDSHDVEYVFWWLLNAPQSGIHLESVYFNDPQLQKYVDPSFKPCAIICTICGNRNRLHGLDLSGAYGFAKIYLGENFSPDLDS